MLTKVVSGGGFGTSLVFLCGAVWHAAPSSPEQDLGKAKDEAGVALTAAVGAYAALKAGRAGKAAVKADAKATTANARVDAAQAPAVTVNVNEPSTEEHVR